MPCSPIDSNLEQKFLEMKLQQQQRESEEDSKWLAEEESNFALLAVRLFPHFIAFLLLKVLCNLKLFLINFPSCVCNP